MNKFFFEKEKKTYFFLSRLIIQFILIYFYINSYLFII